MEFRRILIVFGTRPEAIKMAPVIKQLSKNNDFDLTVCVSAQHREMLDQVLDLFDIDPDYDLNVMTPGQALDSLTSDILVKFSALLDQVRPDLVLVHGDTTTAFASALASFYKKIAVGHVEAGLRSGNINAPWPEEMNRRFVGQVAQLHFAPTRTARDNLLAEGVPANRIWVTGNTVIDALKDVLEKPRAAALLSALPAYDATRRLILVTGHRRESFGSGIEAVCAALRRLAEAHHVSIVFPVHPNPSVMEPVHRLLDEVSNVHLVAPMGYHAFVSAMDESYMVITDSGGVQEEAPSLGKPVLVMRETTERPEAVAAGTVKLVGVDEDRIFHEASRLLTDQAYYLAMSTAHNPYGDGRAAERIAGVIRGNVSTDEF
ncbi:non-hydrolyzing UDP-N-acetylglucosamine 2-epimerase [Devosia beringensis]|uniref:non-hydrolyzing UDP-N-acetylglucosamine 2-epimerase n=1 Tax=Devosia beringensis TaxID=2657486 RepID=UPI00186B7BEF|nr:UDP-N-acetylglucosamine 2-epimerase (non-hydrolyzing) [Devosia beringensis]